jgi:hypothetical protein
LRISKGLCNSIEVTNPSEPDLKQGNYTSVFNTAILSAGVFMGVSRRGKTQVSS